MATAINNNFSQLIEEEGKVVEDLQPLSVLCQAAVSLSLSCPLLMTKMVMSFQPLVHYSSSASLSFSAALLLHRSSCPFILPVFSQLQNDLSLSTTEWSPWLIMSLLLYLLVCHRLLQFIYCRSTCSRVGWMTEREANFTIHFDGRGKTLKGQKYWTSEEEDITHKNLVLVGITLITWYRDGDYTHHLISREGKGLYQQSTDRQEKTSERRSSISYHDIWYLSRKRNTKKVRKTFFFLWVY